MRVLVVGDLMVVVSGRVERMPRPGENVVLSEPSVHVSGVAANIALNLRTLGIDVTVVSAVGIDPFGDAVVRELVDAGIDASFVVRRRDASTGAMVVMVGPDAERTMVGTRGAATHYRLVGSKDLLDEVQPDWLHVSGYTLMDDTMAKRCHALALEARRRELSCSLDLEGATGKRLVRATVRFSNVDRYPRVLGRRRVEPSPGSTLIVKAGGEGCYVAQGGLVTHVPTRAVDAVDATGAGDAFDAAFIAARLRGLDLETACRWGNEAGARTVAVAGPRAPLASPAGPWS